MSEKRFVIDEKTNYKDYPIILDTQTNNWWIIQDTMMGTEKLLDLLNELFNENDVLKQKLKTKYIVNKQYEEMKRLQKENEKLKEQKQRLIHHMNRKPKR